MVWHMANLDGKMSMGFWLKNQEETDRLEDLGIDGE
jgi:hypothetical protein